MILRHDNCGGLWLGNKLVAVVFRHHPINFISLFLAAPQLLDACEKALPHCEGCAELAAVLRQAISAAKGGAA